MFAIGCKQANNSGGHEPAISDEITITVKGDDGVTVNKSNTIKIKKSSTWKSVKQKAVEKITTKENKEIKEWRIKDSNGAILKDADKFEKDVIVFAVSKDKEKPTPPTNPIIITIEIDGGYTFKETTKPCTIEVQKGSAWSSIKAKAEAKIELEDGYEKTGWKLGGKDGSYIDDTHVFNANTSVYATSKKKGEPDKPRVTITVKGDGGVEVGSPNNFTVDSGSKWSSIKAKAENKIELKNSYEKTGWKLGGGGGAYIEDGYVFNEDAIVFATSKLKNQDEKPKVHITVRGDEGVDIATPNTFLIDRGSKWGDVKAQAIPMASAKENFEIKEWRMYGDHGDILTDDSQFDSKYYYLKIFVVSKRQEITIAVKGDVGINIANPSNLVVGKGLKWGTNGIKEQALTIASAKENFEIKEWHLNNESGELLEYESVFKENAIVFATSKLKVAKYKVEHYQENIDNDEYSLIETERKEGNAGENTNAKAKQYDGFIAQSFSQTLIKVDGSTVVKIEYKRLRVSLILDLKGGDTTTELKAGGILEGKVGANVKVATPTKDGSVFSKWEPDLPKTFSSNDAQKKYIALWGQTIKIEIISGDERLNINNAQIHFSYDEAKTWSDVKAKVAEQISLKAEWDKDDYEIYDYRWESYEGEEIKDDTLLKSVMRVYPRSNYSKFNWIENTIIVGFTGKKPKGKIIIPAKTTALKKNGFDYNNEAFYECYELESVDFSGCTALEKIGYDSFIKCRTLKNISLKGCTSLKVIDGPFSGCDALETIDLSGCTALEKLEDSSLKGNRAKTVDLRGCTSLKEIEAGAFPESLENLYLEGCRELTDFATRENAITNLDFSSFQKLKEIDIYKCDNLESVNLTGCYELKEVSIRYSKKIRSIDLSSHSKLKEIDFAHCESLETLNLRDCTSLEKINYDDEDSNFWGCILEGCKSLKNLDVRGCTELTELGLHQLPITNIDVSLCPKLEKLIISECNAFENINLEEHEELKYLKLRKNSGIKKIELSSLPKIVYIRCSDCPNLETVNVTKCGFRGLHNFSSTDASDLFTNCGALQDVNIRECENLKEIHISCDRSNISMRRLNISSCVNFKNLVIYNATNLEILSITECSNFEGIQLEKVPLIKSVDLSSFPLLQTIRFLWCPNLETIKMAESGHRDLHTFGLVDVGVKSVDLSKCPKIGTAAFCACPNLEFVDLSGCSALRSTAVYYAPTSSGSPKAEVRLPLVHSPGVLFALEEYSFGKDEASWCKKVFVANERIKQKVIKTGYPENRIEIYQP